jgi:flavin reductase
MIEIGNRRHAPQPADRAAFVGAMAAAVTGVNVVTTDGAAGRFGLTVSAMASVSADPPLLLVAVSRHSPLLPAIRANRVFAVSVLGAHQAAVADTFAGRPDAGEPYDFGCASWELGASVAPLLAGAAARFDCDVSTTVEAGSHTLVIGAVRAATRGAVRPLAYTRRAYARAEPLPPDAADQTGCRMTGRLAAPASSSRRTGVVWGAARAVSGSSAASARISPTTSANASSVSRVSVSVGSTRSASSTSSGK